MRALRAVLFLVAASACAEGPVAPPPALPVASSPAAGSTEAPPPLRPVLPEPLRFPDTTDAATWIGATFHPARPTRVLVVSAGAAPTHVPVRLLGFEPASRVTEEMPVDRAFPTLQAAADAARGGDAIAILPGRYDGFVLGDVPDAADGKYVHFQATGRPGEVVVDAPPPGSDPRWMIWLRGAHHAVLEGLALAGDNAPGKELRGAWAGVLIDGDFVHTGSLAHHLAFLGLYAHGLRNWGLHSVDSHSVLIQDGVFASSGKEHGAYVSDGSDDYVIRRNVFEGNDACGLQVNLDPLASLSKLVDRGDAGIPPLAPTRAWAEEALARATARFGENRFPDGRGRHFLIEGNVVHGNGRVGGAGINLAGVRESVVQNNLVYGNHSAGIAAWDNGNPFDEATVHPGPQGPGDVTGPGSLPLFGCVDDVVRDNTVLGAVPGRAALIAGNGSYGMKVANNVLVNDGGASIAIGATAIWRFEAERDVLGRVQLDGAAETMAALATALPSAPGSTLGVTRPALASSFVRYGDGPWVRIETPWWSPDPGRPDFHPRRAARPLVGQGDAQAQAPADLDGVRRTTADVGAYAAAP